MPVKVNLRRGEKCQRERAVLALNRGGTVRLFNVWASKLRQWWKEQAAVGFQCIPSVSGSHGAGDSR